MSIAGRCCEKNAKLTIDSQMYNGVGGNKENKENMNAGQGGFYRLHSSNQAMT